MFSSHILGKTYQYLLLILAFLIPLTVFGANLIIVIIVILWAISGDYKKKFNKIITNKLMLASIAFYLLHIVGLIWTEDIKWGIHIAHKMWYFLLLFPILHTIVEKRYINYYIFSFLLAISLTELISYLTWFELIPSFYKGTAYNPTPFMSHISYNPILAFSIYLVCNKLLITNYLSIFSKFLYSFFIMTMSVNMFITGGRAGQVMFFVIIAILIFQYFHNQKIKALILAFISIPVIFLIAFNTSAIFHDRVEAAIDNVVHYSDNKSTSVGQRITYTLNSFEIIKQHPIIGVGTGDFPLEYKKIKNIRTPEMENSTNPHNMYVLITVQLGLIGLLSFLSIFYYQLKFSLRSSDELSRNVGTTLSILFLIIMLSDSYLLGHYTSLMFIFFSSFLHKDYEKS